MTNDRFFRGFLAALASVGENFIVTRDNAHHKQFKAVVSRIGHLSKEAQEELPVFIPSPFTDRFRELEDALLQMQRGFLGAQNPFYPGVHLDITPERAKAILDQFPPEQHALFLQLANAYKERGTADVTLGDETRDKRP